MTFLIYVSKPRWYFCQIKVSIFNTKLDYVWGCVSDVQYEEIGSFWEKISFIFHIYSLCSLGKGRNNKGVCSCEISFNFLPTEGFLQQIQSAQIKWNIMVNKPLV